MNEETNFPGRKRKETPSDAPTRQQAKKGAGTCLLALFAIAFLLLLMAHFMQKRPVEPSVNQPLPPVTQSAQEEAPSFLGSRYIIN